MSVLGNNLLAQYYAQNQDDADVVLVISTETQLEWGVCISHHGINGASTIFWGDGTNDLVVGEGAFGTLYTHVYAEHKEYTIKVKTHSSYLYNFKTNGVQSSEYEDPNGYAAMVRQVKKWDGLYSAIARGYAFSSCSNAVFPHDVPALTTTAGDRCFQNCLGLKHWFANLKSVGTACFANTGISVLELSADFRSVGSYSFAANNSLASVTFLGKPNSITSFGFNNCPNLTTIRVPWSEGEVANAPWGATNATIIYNYQP